MSDGYDYGPGPGYGFGGPPPFAASAPVLFLLLMVVLIAAGVATGVRQGRSIERRRLQEQRERTAQVIFSAIRQPLNAALLATGERVFAPTRTLIETIDLYLGAVIQLSGAVGPIQNLKKALTTTQKEVEVKPEPGHGHGHGVAHPIAQGPTYAFAAPQPTIILTTPVAGQPGQASASSAGGASVASASSDTGSGVHVIQPAPMSPMVLTPAGPGVQPTSGGHPGVPVAPISHGPPEVKKEKVDLTLKEQARNVREALEALSDYWQEDRIKDHIAKAQAALTIYEKLGTVNEKAAERAGFFAPRARTVRNDGGSLLRPAAKPKG